MPLKSRINNQKTKKEEREEALKRQQEEYEKAAKNILFPMIEECFKELQDNYKEVKQFVVYVRALHKGNFEFQTEPETIIQVKENPTTLSNRDMLFHMMSIAEECGMETEPFKPEWNGWVYTFKKTL